MSGDESDSDGDNRWRKYKQPETINIMGMSRQKTKADVFNEHLTKILLLKSQRQNQENKCKTAAQLIKLVTDIAYAVNTEWKSYIPAGRNGVKTAPLRTLAEDKYECMVPLVRALRLDGFAVVQRGNDEMPQHRCLIQINPALCKEEAHLIRREWEPFVDKEGYLRPRAILEWFNKGLSQAVPILLSDNHNVDKLGLAVSDDGTATLNVTMTDFDGDALDINTFSVNIYPVYTMARLPTTLKLNAPLPCFGNYIHGQKEFRRLVMDDIDEGKCVAFLDPKSENIPIKKCLPKDGPTWKINLSFTEYHVYTLIDKYCRGLNFRHVLVLMNILREENKSDLGVLNNDLLVNTLFNVSQKHIDKIRTKEMWIYMVMQTLCDCLKCNFLPCFYLPRQNLLNSYNIRKRDQAKAHHALDVILNGIQNDPRTMYTFTGLEEPTPRQTPRKKKPSARARSAAEDPGTDDVDADCEPEMEEEQTGFYEDKSVSHSGWPIEKAEHPRSGRKNREPEQEEDSGISKRSKGGQRSDIY